MTMIKPKRTLFKKKLKVWFMNASKLGLPSLGDAPKVLDSVDVISPVGEDLGMINPHVMKFCEVECIVRLESVGVKQCCP
jgi:hypothetical protein